MSIALELSKQKFDAMTKEIEDKVGTLVAERDQLGKDIKKLERGTGGNSNGTPATSDADLIAAVGATSKANGGNAVTSSQIAQALGVDSRSIARRLAKFGADGTIQGNKESGYTAA